MSDTDTQNSPENGSTPRAPSDEAPAAAEASGTQPGAQGPGTSESPAGGDATKGPAPDEALSAQRASGAEPAPEEETPRAEAPAPPDPLALAASERDRFKDQLMRTLADFDNFRKRARRDEQDALRRGKEEVLRELLPVFDNLERAAQYARTGAEPKAIAEGVQMVLRLFDDTIVRLGGTRIRAVGQPFDPNHHEAIQQVESAEHPAGVVAQELVAGYQLGDRLLRPAMVVVSKGPPAASGTDAKADNGSQ